MWKKRKKKREKSIYGIRLDIYISWWNFSSNGKYRKSEQK